MAEGCWTKLWASPTSLTKVGEALDIGPDEFQESGNCYYWEGDLYQAAYHLSCLNDVVLVGVHEPTSDGFLYRTAFFVDREGYSDFEVAPDAHSFLERMAIVIQPMNNQGDLLLEEVAPTLRKYRRWYELKEELINGER